MKIKRKNILGSSTLNYKYIEAQYQSRGVNSDVAINSILLCDKKKIKVTLSKGNTRLIWHIYEKVLTNIINICHEE